MHSWHSGKHYLISSPYAQKQRTCPVCINRGHGKAKRFVKRRADYSLTTISSARMSSGRHPSRSEISRNSTTSSRRSPLSTLDTNDCGRRSRKARSTWVMPACSRAATRSSTSRAYLGDDRERAMPRADLFCTGHRRRIANIPNWDSHASRLAGSPYSRA